MPEKKSGVTTSDAFSRMFAGDRLAAAAEMAEKGAAMSVDLTDAVDPKPEPAVVPAPSPAEMCSGKWRDPGGMVMTLKAPNPSAYRALCRTKLGYGWKALEPYPADGVVLVNP